MISSRRRSSNLPPHGPEVTSRLTKKWPLSAASNHWSWPRSPSNGSDRLIGPPDWSIFQAGQPVIAGWKPVDFPICRAAAKKRYRRSRSESMTTGFPRGRSRLGARRSDQKVIAFPSEAMKEANTNTVWVCSANGLPPTWLESSFLWEWQGLVMVA